MKPWPRPDFLARDPGRPLLAWVLLATGGLVCALGGVDLLDLHQDRGREAQQLARWSAAEQSATRPRGAATAPAVQPVRQVKAAWQVQQRLAYRWERLFAGVENASPPGVQWLALDHDGERAEVRLDGSAPDVAAALQAVQALAACEGWSDVALRSVGDAGTAPRGGLRFELAARLAAQPAAGAWVDEAGSRR